MHLPHSRSLARSAAGSGDAGLTPFVDAHLLGGERRRRRSLTAGSDGRGRWANLVAIHQQISWSDRLGSPFTARVLTILAAEISAGGPAAILTDGWPGDPLADALALRMARALHALVLMDAEPDLVACYPPNASAGMEPLRALLPRVLERRQDFIGAFLASPPQTNEVGRSAVLLEGFLQIASTTGLPLRLLEIGATSGLNTIWDRYGYRFGGAAWGDPRSPVRLSPDWSGPLPPLQASPQVVARHACDLAPIDLEEADARLRLRACVWADQRERLSRLEAAIALTRKVALRVERADASAWMRMRLDEAVEKCVNVLYHSIMWQYLLRSSQDDIAQSIRHAGIRATPSASVGWLRFEPPRSHARPELHLTLWPGGRDRRLAIAHPHGSAVTWFAT